MNLKIIACRNNQFPVFRSFAVDIYVNRTRNRMVKKLNVKIFVSYQFKLSNIILLFCK
jgi:hypothetical protein